MEKLKTKPSLESAESLIKSIHHSTSSSIIYNLLLTAREKSKDTEFVSAFISLDGIKLLTEQLKKSSKKIVINLKLFFVLLN